MTGRFAVLRFRAMYLESVFFHGRGSDLHAIVVDDSVPFAYYQRILAIMLRSYCSVAFG
jgi:hypothetical protein